MVRRRGFDGTEWQCKKCNQLNYASNKVCYRCSYSKAEAELEEVRRQQQAAQKQKVLAYIEQLNKQKNEGSSQPQEMPAAAGSTEESFQKKDEVRPPPAEEQIEKKSRSRSPRARSRSRDRSKSGKDRARRRREREGEVPPV